MPPVTVLRRALVDAHRAGVEAGRDAATPVTSCPYSSATERAERRVWVRGFTRGRVAARLPTPSEVAELVDDASEVDPARLVDGDDPPR